MLAFALVSMTGSTGSAEAGDVTAFMAFPSPGDQWERGYGAALTSTWFNVLSFEGEAARIPGVTPAAIAVLDVFLNLSRRSACS